MAAAIPVHKLLSLGVGDTPRLGRGNRATAATTAANQPD
eukprot:CAMPEP_0177247190 /NCGR_PEP_ID=MMETSP0367-20130122/51435_1 /TAXON_ID=447022 ORGANISM="Scrippsiella hangoei-like, Strain SHHI-4" /NCGR_SAMPLE_ID=MMETSP0367 /ASSEMBLY_ACC=CAM_ASM_000362 /LENGTH=38 /DNA_ID= /DNA_START= /DNA_END= /DNA_ORIENTATION=